MPANSFDAKSTLEGRRSLVRDLPPRRPAGEVRRRPPAVLAEDPAREPAPQRGRRDRSAPRTSRRWRRGTPRPSRPRRSPSRRRACSCRTSPACRRSSTWPRCATPWATWAATRRRSTRWCRPSWSSTTRCRSTPSARPSAFQRNAELEFERNQERYAFLRWGQEAFHNFSVVPPDTGIVHQVNLEYLARVVFVDDGDGRAPGLSRHAGRHRLAHDDDQRPRRARLGRGRDRGRGGDARPADVDADPAGARLQADRRAAGGRHRHRPRADRDRDAARARRGRQVRRVLRRRPGQPARWPTGPRSATCRPSSARPARSSRSTPRRCATWSSPAARPS